MKESKYDLTVRLRKEGRWAEASLFKDNEIRRLRAEGVVIRSECNDKAWELMEEKYPPLPVAEVESEVTQAIAVDPNPWTDLPSDADFNEEVRWVHQQYALIVEETPRGRVIHWDRATKPPPSHGARSLALWAADNRNNRTAFYKDVLPKAMSAASNSGDEADSIREEKRSIAEVQRILEKMSQ